MKLFLVLLTLASGFSLAQDFNMPVSSEKRQGFSFDKFPLPNNILLSKLDREKVTLQTHGKLTFLQIWSICCGAEPDVWAQALDISETYGSYGMETISINFENGSGLKAQIRDVQKFLKTAPAPKNLLLDGLGYTVDFLHVPGFPTYYLVDTDNQVVFRTNGKDAEGLKLLKEEIEKRIQ